jgi:hypothetical protein
METLRKPFFIAAVILSLITVLLESGSGLFLGGEKADVDKLFALAPHLAASRGDVDPESIGKNTPPGKAIGCVGVLDGLVLFTVGLIGLPLFITHRVHGKVQGLATVIVAVLALIFAFYQIFRVLGEVLLMIGLFMATPFGQIAYLAAWGFFDRGGAAVVLGLGMALKLCFAGFLILAHQRFLQNKGLVLIILTSLVAGLIVSFLHGLVPIFLVSITDGVAAIIVLILVVVWAIFLLIGGIMSVFKAIV